MLFRGGPSLDVPGEEPLLARGHRAVEVGVLRGALTCVRGYTQPAVTAGLLADGYAAVGPRPLGGAP